MKIYRITLLLTLLSLANISFAQCTINLQGNNTNVQGAQAAVQNSANANVMAAFIANNCEIREGWHPGGAIPAGLPGNALHITVRIHNVNQTCHIFDYPLPGGTDYPTTCQ